MATKKATEETTTTEMQSAQNMTLAELRSQMAQQMESMKERLGAPSSNKIRLTGKKFTFPDGSVEEGPIRVIILEFTTKNAFYTGRYDAQNPRPPVCWAIGDNISTLAPSDNVPEPQSADCASCPKNQFGSGNTPKECKNSRMLAVLPLGADPETAELMTLEVSPTGIKSFDGHVTRILEAFTLPPVAAITEIGFHPDRDYPSLIFGNFIPNEDVERYLPRMTEGKRLVSIEPTTES